MIREGVLPRYVSGEALLLGGKHLLPLGTQVGTSPYTVNRDHEIFGEDAELFDVNRWLVNLAIQVFDEFLTVGICWLAQRRHCR